MKMPVCSFILADAVASLFTVAFMVTAGHQGRKLFAYLDWLKPEWRGLTAIAVLLIITILIVRRNRSRQQPSEPAITPEGSNA